MIIASTNSIVFLSDLPGLLKEKSEIKFYLGEHGQIINAIYEEPKFRFVFTQHENQHARFLIVQDGYELEYYTWCLSPYWVRHNSYTFLNLDPAEALRWQHYAQQTVSTLEEIKSSFYAKTFLFHLLY